MERLSSQPREGVDAVILAGSVNRIPLYRGSRPGFKALVEMRGRPLIAYVLDALHEAAGVDRVLVVGSPEVLEYARRWPRVEGVPDGHSLVRNVWRGLQAARSERVLFCNPDQPLLRPEMIREFLELSLPRDAQVVSSWVRGETLGRYARDGEHKLATFGDGRYAHGNLFLVQKHLPDSQDVRQRLDRVYRARKSNLRFAWALGLPLFLRYLWALMHGHLPTLAETLAIGGAHFGLKVEPVICSYPEIVLDIDEPEDYDCARRWLTADSQESAPVPLAA
jgi:molybdopterin-guanine dinucleotide biosynthesis protein A